jgi:hypothetical protein
LGNPFFDVDLFALGTRKDEIDMLSGELVVG